MEDKQTKCFRLMVRVLRGRILLVSLTHINGQKTSEEQLPVVDREIHDGAARPQHRSQLWKQSILIKYQILERRQIVAPVGLISCFIVNTFIQYQIT